MERAIERLAALQTDVESARLVCVLAHVDHGKTTLSDGLIAHNGFISRKQAGSLRFMDFLEDEQRRGITMKSAGISLLYTPKATATRERPKPALITLIDSPGHVDFCSEVSTAARLSDGCIVVVDVVEGVCVQTHAVLRQAWEERLKPCLVFNKLDRLIIELGYTTTEAYDRIRMLLNEVNGLMSAFESEKFISRVDTFLSAESARDERNGAGSADETATTSDYLEDDGALDDEVNEEDVFNVARGNVAFGSAVDGWAFRPDAFSELYAEKLGCSEAALRKALSGDWYYHPKMKKIVSRKVANGKLKPLFVQCILDPIWKLYNVAESEKNGEWVEKDLVTLAKSLKVDVPEKDLAQSDRRMALQNVMRAWLPMSPCLLEMVYECVPSPRQAAPRRINRVLPQPVLRKSRPEGVDDARRAVIACEGTREAMKIVFVSKMIAVPKSHVQGAARGEPNGDDMKFLAFARVYSGTLRKGDKVYVLHSGHDPSDYDADMIEEVTLSELYLMMGQGMFLVDEVPAGNLLAIGGIERSILKSATLSSSLECPPFGEMMFQASAIVKVAVEPENVTDMDALIDGLRLLNRADAFVEVSVMDTGEHVIAAAGEVHLERCIADLRERFAKVPIRVSPPIVSFRETVTAVSTAQSTTANGRVTISCTVKPLPNFIIRAIDDSSEQLKVLLLGKPDESVEENKTILREFMDKLNSAREAVTYEEQGPETIVADTFRSAWVLGPKRVGANILNVGTYTADVDDEEKEFGHANAAISLGLRKEYEPEELDEVTLAAVDFDLNAAQGSVLTGFQMATDRGPLCDEPLTGVQMTLNVSLNPKSDGSGEQEEQFGPLSGQIINSVRDAIRKAVMKAGTRLVEAMYLAVITTTSDALGGTYAVLGKRRSQILSETIREGTGVFVIHAYLPVASSFGFVDQLRAQTSGASTAQLVFSHWSQIEVDPFFTPTTEEEREEFGEDGDVGPNIARELMNSVRRRKGLKVRRARDLCFARLVDYKTAKTDTRATLSSLFRWKRRSYRWRRNSERSRGRRRQLVEVFLWILKGFAHGENELNLRPLLSHARASTPGIPFLASTVVDRTIFFPNGCWSFVFAFVEELRDAVASVPKFGAYRLSSRAFDVAPLQ